MLENDIGLWCANLPVPKDTDHKYTRGQVAVLGGPEMAGAACLTAHGASRIGAGLVMIISPFFDMPRRDGAYDPMSVYRSFMPHLIIREGQSFLDFVRQAERKGRVVPVIGPGLGPDYGIIRRIVVGALKRNKPVVLDADALNAFEGHLDELLAVLHAEAVLTPHEGEYVRLFKQSDFKATKAVIIRKGARTFISREDRENVVNTTASPYLATAGSGDVLAGIVAGLMAQGMPAFEAACAGVWMHGKAAQIHGPGLIAGDIPNLIPKVLQEVLGFHKNLR